MENGKERLCSTFRGTFRVKVTRTFRLAATTRCLQMSLAAMEVQGDLSSPPLQTVCQSPQVAPLGSCS